MRVNGHDRFYLSAKALGSAEGRRMISRLLSIVEVAPVSRAVLEDALASKFTGFEEAVVHESGRHAGCDTLVTRNGRDFQKALLPVYDPHELVCLLEEQR